MATRASFARIGPAAGWALGLICLGALAAFGMAGWMRHGEALWLAMAHNAWAMCF